MTAPILNEHIVCNCGHEQSQHVFAVGCTVKYAEGKRCPCDRYSQTELKRGKNNQQLHP